MGLTDGFYASKIGPSGSLAYTAGASTAAHRIMTQLHGAILLQLFSTQDIYIHQGGANMAPATVNHFLLYANTYWPLAVETESDNYIRVYCASFPGSLIITNVSNLNDQPRTTP